MAPSAWPVPGRTADRYASFTGCGVIGSFPAASTPLPRRASGTLSGWHTKQVSPDPVSETLLALARFSAGQLPAAREEAQRLSGGQDPAHLPLAELWHTLGETEQAAKHARAAYRHAWADGEPYVRRYSLDRAKSLLKQLGEDIPALPAYDPAQDPKDPWEDEIEASIMELQEQAQSKS